MTEGADKNQSVWFCSLRWLIGKILRIYPGVDHADLGRVNVTPEIVSISFRDTNDLIDFPTEFQFPVTSLQTVVQFTKFPQRLDSSRAWL